MKVILGTDSLMPPLTGIGRYTKELLSGLLSSPEIEDLRCFSLGRWHAPQEYLGAAEHSAADQVRLSTAGQVRQWLARREWAVQTYQTVAGVVERLRLHRYRQYLFHSPNFHLPSFEGRSVCTIHDLSYLRFPQFHPHARVSFLSRAVPEAVKRADLIITDSLAIKSEVECEFRIDPSRVCAIPLGVEAQFLNHIPSPSRESLRKFGLADRPFFLCVGTIEPRKNLSTLLDAWEALPASIRKTHVLAVVGTEGWHCDDVMHRLQTTAHVAYLDYVPRASLTTLLDAATALVFPSYYEGFGLPLLEAQAIGTPVIASDIPTSREIGHALVKWFPPADSSCLAVAMTEAAEDDAWRRLCAEAGRRNASNFSWERCVAQTIACYDLALMD